eukprot:gene18037-18274_t
MMRLIIDNFAGGGGASTGIEAALGRAVDIAINHDEQAIRMHEVNHPGTLHIRNNIWQVDPRDVVQGRAVDLAWFSPDCKHFSKAKGGKPREKSIRDLAWVVVLWAKRVQPAVILLENVEEFQTWGPLCDEGQPIKARAGETFRKWCNELRRAGYKLQFRELRACDYGAPTIRKRFFMIARRDGQPIVWPSPTHGKPVTPDVLSGKLKPWRTAAEIINWSIPCPSIFERKKPLAEKTLRRIAHGIMKFVVNNPRPFIVPLTHHGSADRVDAVLAPYVTYAQQGGNSRPVEKPLHTVCASRKDQNCIAAAHLVHIGNGEREGQAPRVKDVETPLGTVVGTNKHFVAVAQMMAAHIEQANGGPNNENLAGRPADAPLSTTTATGSQQRLKDHMHGIDAALQAITMGMIEVRPNGEVWRIARNVKGRIVAQTPVRAECHLKNGYLGVVSRFDGEQYLVLAHRLVWTVLSGPIPPKLDINHMDGVKVNNHPSNLEIVTRGENARHAYRTGLKAPAIAPIVMDMAPAAKALRAQGKSFREIGEALGIAQTTAFRAANDRFGLVIVTIEGEEYVITDIGMRMLTPRELFNAQGFPPDYIIDHDAGGRPITKTAQVAKCGNSVCPPLAEALVRANMTSAAARAARAAA